MSEALLHALSLMTLVAIHLGLALCLGSAASQLWLGRTSSSSPMPWQKRTGEQALALRRTGLAIGLLGILAAAWLEAAIMGNTGLLSAGTTLRTLLSRSHFGHAWLLGLGAWLVGGLLLLSARPTGQHGRPLPACLAAMATFALTRSVVSHAGSEGEFTLAVAVDWLHLVLVCLWVGIVAAGAMLKLPDALSASGDRALAARWVALMSSTATGTLVGIVLTGAFKVWRGWAAVGSFEAYVWSAYGQALLVKLLFVGAAAMLGGFNRFVVMPRLLLVAASQQADASRWRKRLLLVLRSELLALLLVLVAAALLSTTELPGG
jgi:putative copper resistance protein D